MHVSALLCTRLVGSCTSADLKHRCVAQKNLLRPYLEAKNHLVCCQNTLAVSFRLRTIYSPCQCVAHSRGTTREPAARSESCHTSRTGCGRSSPGTWRCRRTPAATPAGSTCCPRARRRGSTWLQRARRSTSSRRGGGGCRDRGDGTLRLPATPTRTSRCLLCLFYPARQPCGRVCALLVSPCANWLVYAARK